MRFKRQRHNFMDKGKQNVSANPISYSTDVRQLAPACATASPLHRAGPCSWGSHRAAMAFWRQLKGACLRTGTSACYKRCIACCFPNGHYRVQSSVSKQPRKGQHHGGHWEPKPHVPIGWVIIASASPQSRSLDSGWAKGMASPPPPLETLVSSF